MNINTEPTKPTATKRDAFLAPVFTRAAYGKVPGRRAVKSSPRLPGHPSPDAAIGQRKRVSVAQPRDTLRRTAGVSERLNVNINTSSAWDYTLKPRTCPRGTQACSLCVYVCLTSHLPSARWTRRTLTCHEQESSARNDILSEASR